MDYRRAINYLESFQKMGIRLGLDRTITLLSLLGNPQNNFKSIHIAGTNGKGSVAAMLSSILCQAGYKVGLYTSPHLVDYTERIRINEKDVSKAEFAGAIAGVKKIIGKLPGLDLTEFEVLTAASFYLLSREGVDIAVIEAGLGGRMDATNVITPILSVITNIDLDHTDILGDSLARIAREKGGIIKQGVPLVTGEPKVWRILYEICRDKRSRFIRSNKERVKYSPFQGEHQIKNTQTAIACVKELRKLGIKISDGQVEKGLRQAFWPGRIQIVGKDPLVILDGAHNPAGARVLSEYLSSLGKKVNFVIGMQKDKDAKNFIKILEPVAGKFFLVRSSHPRAASERSLAHTIRLAGGEAVIKGSIKGALSQAKKGAGPICITGSLYLAGDALRQKLFDL